MNTYISQKILKNYWRTNDLLLNDILDKFNIYEKYINCLFLSFSSFQGMVRLFTVLPNLPNTGSGEEHYYYRRAYKCAE